MHKALLFEGYTLHRLSKSMHNNNNFKIEECRRKVASLLAQSMTETEIAEQLNVDQSIVSRDVKALKEMSQQFLFDLAKSHVRDYFGRNIGAGQSSVAQV